MSDHKLTEAEIMKALEICTTKGASCKNCPAFVKVDRSRCKEVFKGAIDLINRKNAEIENKKRDCEILFEHLTSTGETTYIEEIARLDWHRKNEESIRRLEEENRRLEEKIERLRELTMILMPSRNCGKTQFIVKKYNEVRAEAIKEVLQRARGKVCCIPQHHFTLEQVLCDLDQIAKEMGCGEC